MAEVKGQQVVTTFEETKQVISLVVGLVKAIKLSQEDGEINWADITNFLPVLFLVGPAIDNIEGVEPEFMMASQEDVEALKEWVRGQVDGLELDEQVTQFISDCFSLVMALWMVLKTYVINTGSNGTASNNNTEPADTTKASE